MTNKQASILKKDLRFALEKIKKAYSEVGASDKIASDIAWAEWYLKSAKKTFNRITS